MFKGLFSSGGGSKSESSDGDIKELRTLLEGMITALVDEPKEIDLTETVDGNSIFFELKVAKSDLGKVIGKQGRTASSMRTILSAAARKYRASADLKILD